MRRMQRTSRALISLLLLTILVALSLANTSAAAPSYGQPVVGQHIYDTANVLTPAQIDTLEQHARQVVAAGAPVVVYLQAKSASYDQTEQDAKDLMDQWDVESTSGAKDGLVIFLNLKPGDLHHGQAALYAGQTHYDGGNLPNRELRRIFSDVMRPDMAQGDLAEGIAAGLDAAASSLRNGPPPPPPPSHAERIARDVSNGPLTVVPLLSLLLSVVLGWFTVRVIRTRPQVSVPIAATLSPPSDTPPAIVGSVIRGRVADDQLVATILDLARRGALVVESGDRKRQAQVRLLDSSVPKTDVEHLVWDSLETHSDDEKVVRGTRLSDVRSSWSDARAALRKDLQDQGLFDPSAPRRRRPVYIAGTVGMILGAAALAVGIIGGQAWAFIGGSLLAIVAFLAMIWISFYPETSQTGAELAATWSSYIEGIKRSKSDKTLDVNLELDEAMPFAVAAGVTSALNKRLKIAAEDGYVPVWLGPSMYRQSDMGNAYIWWIGFHSAVTPSSSGSSAGGGGASAGGGGAGGSF